MWLFRKHVQEEPAPAKPHKFCSYCGQPMKEFALDNRFSKYDTETGALTHNYRWVMACSSVQEIDDTSRYHDGWLGTDWYKIADMSSFVGTHGT